MFNFLRGFHSSSHMNPYAVDVIRAKRKDLVYGISHTEDLLNLLVKEGVLTAAKRSVVLTIRTRRDQNSRVLEILEARGERACRKFFHPCLMVTEPDLYQEIKSYVGNVNQHVGDTRRQLIGYLLERDQGAAEDKRPQRAAKTRNNETKRSEKNKRTKKPGGKSQVSSSQSRADGVAMNGRELLSQEPSEETDSTTVNPPGETLLHVTAEDGDLEASEILVRNGARLNQRDDAGHTALHRAACRGHADIVRALVKAGASVHCLDSQGKTPVHLAAENDHTSCVEVLVEEEAKLADGGEGDLFLHMAAVEDSWRLAEMLLHSGAAVDARNSQKKTALFYAVQGNNDKTASALLNAGAKVDFEILNEAIRNHQETILKLLLANISGSLDEEALSAALLSAVKENQVGAVGALIDNGADVNTCDKQGYTPLLLSAQMGQAEVFSMLVANQASLDATLPDLSSVLHLAVVCGSVSIVKTLLEVGVDPNATEAKGLTPLHLAAQREQPELVDMLIKAGAQVDAVSQDGLTPLHLASQQGHSDTVMQLLQAGAVVGLRDRLGRTALHWAATAQGDGRAVDALLSAKADPNVADHEKRTALHLAAAEGKADAVASLLTHKAKGGARDMRGSTALHYAAAGGHVGVALALLRAAGGGGGGGVGDKNAWRKTPLHAAAEKGRDGMAALLLEAGAKVNATDHSKDTPLHCAARGGHQDVVKRLLNWGPSGHAGRRDRADLQVTNKVGKTPLQVAESENTAEHENIATLLKRKMFLIK